MAEANKKEDQRQDIFAELNINNNYY